MHLTRVNTVGDRAVLTQYGSIGGPTEPPKRQPGRYVCVECGDASIIFRTAVDEFKTKCPKCGTQMVRQSNLQG